jgi:hypothetical protein
MIGSFGLDASSSACGQTKNAHNILVGESNRKHNSEYMEVCVSNIRKILQKYVLKLWTEFM